MIVGYARVSTTDQDYQIQVDALEAAGAEKVFADKATGTNTKREQLTACLDFVREGDVLLVTRLDRLARSQKDLHNLLAGLTERKVGFRCTEQAIDTTTSMGKLMLGVLGAVAEFETDLRRERQQEGIERAKRQGKYKGGTARIDPCRVRMMLAQGKRPVDIAKELGCNRASVYRLAK
jgi:DNA invertase Pin-like site-specific DNA recombinase